MCRVQPRRGLLLLVVELIGGQERPAGAGQMNPVTTPPRAAPTLQKPVLRPDYLLASPIPPWRQLANNFVDPSVCRSSELRQLLDRARCLCHKHKHLHRQNPCRAGASGIAPEAQHRSEASQQAPPSFLRLAIAIHRRNTGRAPASARESS